MSINEIRLIDELGTLLKKGPENWPPQSYRDYDYSPIYALDKSPIRTILRPLMLMRANGKVSHWWTYRSFPNDIPNEHRTPEGLVLPGDPTVESFSEGNALDRRIAAIKMSLGGWNTAYYIFPNWDLMSQEQQIAGWRYGYASVDGKIQEFSNIVNRYHVLALVGRDNFKVFGIEAKSFREIPVIAIKTHSGRNTQVPIN